MRFLLNRLRIAGFSAHSMDLWSNLGLLDPVATSGFRPLLVSSSFFWEAIPLNSTHPRKKDALCSPWPLGISVDVHVLES